MSLNTAHALGGVLIFAGERILIFYNGVEMHFDMPGGIAAFKGKKKGRAYLTTHRIIFNCSDTKDTLQSFSMPFYTMRHVELEQPVFGSNYIKGEVSSEQGGNWSGSGKFKMYFTNGGAIEFGRAMLIAGQMASRYISAPPPPYIPATANYYQAPPPAYCPPQGPAYGFVPYQTFPDNPPANSVYMTDAPPPYPGIDPNLPPYVPQQQPSAPVSNAASAKAMEAAASAYYDPSNPHNIYMPAATPSAPPSYDQALNDKKYQ